MIDNIENKIKDLSSSGCSLKNRSVWKLVILLKTYIWNRDSNFRIVLYRKLHLSSKIIYFGFESLWLFSQPIIQWNYVIYFHPRGSFFNNFLHQFLERVYNSKEIVNLQDLFVLTVDYVTKYYITLTKYYYFIERVYFIYKYFILFNSTFSFLDR